jgi:hypothetical protein
MLSLAMADYLERQKSHRRARLHNRKFICDGSCGASSLSSTAQARVKLLRAFTGSLNIATQLEIPINRCLGIDSRAFEQALRVDRPPSDLSLATPGPLPATQGQR